MEISSEKNDWLSRLSHFSVEYASDAIFWIDKEARIHRVNKEAIRRYGYSEQEFLMMTIHQINPYYNKKEWKAIYDEIKTRKTLRFESVHLTKDDREIPVEILTNYIEIEGQEFLCSFARDIRERIAHEKKINDQHKLLEDSINSLTHPFYVIDVHNYEIILHNKAANILENKSISTCYALSHGFNEPCKGDNHPCTIAQVLEKRQPVTVQHLHKDRNGKSLFFEIHAYPVLNEKEEVSHVIEYSIDITRRKKAEDDLREALQEVKKLKNRLEAENVYLQQEIKLDHNFEEIITASDVFKKVLGKVEQVSSTDASVLILGETGTGKELLARAVHNISQRSKRPLVKVNCAALPANLIESEFFGHERGAFTGALARKIGRFELADGGTIFLDEIGDLPLELQTKLLRVLQEGEFERIGSTQTIKVDVRIIAATNVELEKEVSKGRFRADLFYRLNVFPITVPPLRERIEDVPILVRHFIMKYSTKMSRKPPVVSKRLLNALEKYTWPGNVRELENVIERAVILTQGSKMEYGDWIPRNTAANISTQVQSLNEVERNHILEVLDLTSWRVSGEKGAAKILKMKPTTLEARMKKLGINRKS